MLITFFGSWDLELDVLQSIMFKSDNFLKVKNASGRIGIFSLDFTLKVAPGALVKMQRI